MHDGIQFEKHDRPAAVIVTDPFIGTCEKAGKMAGLAGYPFVVIPHPISRLSREQLREVAATAAEVVRNALVRA